MTKDEKIKGHFSAIAECAGNLRRNFDPNRVVENDEVAQYLRKQLDAIEGLLSQDEPEIDVVTRSNTWLRKRLTFKDESLEASRAAAKALKQELATTEALLRVAERRVKSLRATCSRMMTTTEVTELRASNVRLLRRNKGLEQDLKDADTHIVELQEDLAKLNAIQDTDRHAFHQMAKYLEVTKELLAHKDRRLEKAGARLEGVKLSLERDQAVGKSYIRALRTDLANKCRMLTQVSNQVVGLQRTLEELGLS